MYILNADFKNKMQISHFKVNFLVIIIGKFMLIINIIKISKNTVKILFSSASKRSENRNKLN